MGCDGGRLAFMTFKQDDSRMFPKTYGGPSDDLIRFRNTNRM